VIVKNPDDEILKKMHSISILMGAKVLGEEGEEYGEHGPVEEVSEVQSTYAKKPWWKFW